MRTLEGQVAIITGASSGIGAATAHELARRGAHVVLAARRIEELAGIERALKEAGADALAIPADVTDPLQVQRLIERAEQTYGRIDILVNNAGVGGGGPFARTTLSEVVQALDLSLKAAILMARAVLPGMIVRQHGAIVSVALANGHHAETEDAPVSSATTLGLRAFSHALRRELRDTGISVSLVSPSFIRTPMNGNGRGKPRGPELVAHAIVHQILHPRREVIVPHRHPVAVLAGRFLPRPMDGFTHPRE